MQINPEHSPDPSDHPAPAPFTHDEWFVLFCTIGYCGGCAMASENPEDKLAHSIALASVAAIKRGVGEEYYAYLKRRAMDKCEAVARDESDPTNPFSG